MKRSRRNILFRLLVTAVLILFAGAWFWDREIAGNSWITFYGRVADAQDVPVQSAIVHIMIIRESFFTVPIPMSNYPESEKINITLTSDGNGNFALRGRHGAYLVIEGIDKSGFVWKDQQVRPFRGQYVVPSLFQYSHAEGRDQSLPLTPQMRVTFVLTPTTVPSP